MAVANTQGAPASAVELPGRGAGILTAEELPACILTDEMLHLLDMSIEEYRLAFGAICKLGESQRGHNIPRHTVDVSHHLDKRYGKDDEVFSAIVGGRNVFSIIKLEEGLVVGHQHVGRLLPCGEIIVHKTVGPFDKAGMRVMSHVPGWFKPS